MKLIPTVDAEGCVLCHDITRIVKDHYKGPAFRKGHVVTREDIPLLLSMGKENLYIFEPQEGMVHEDDAAQTLCRMLLDDAMDYTGPKEGKIEITAARDGLFKVHRKELACVNLMPEFSIASIPNLTPVKKGDKLGGGRIIPLFIPEERLREAEVCSGIFPLFELWSYHPKKAAILITGSEVYKGLISDTFGPVIREKLADFPCEVVDYQILPDTPEAITAAILSSIQQKGADLVFCTGGMSVDPDDRTPLAIRSTGAKIVSYGAPVLPGSMFLLAYYETDTQIVPVCGLPGCVMYARRTVFDLVLPRLMADDRISAAELAELGVGGFCLNCPECTYPKCGFGKGW